MKVKISYSVELEEIPDKVRDLLKSVSSELEYVASSIPSDVVIDMTVESVADFAEKIDKVRQKLFILDSKLEDAATIAGDWYQTSVSIEAKKLGLDQPQAEAENVEND